MITTRNTRRCTFAVALIAAFGMLALPLLAQTYSGPTNPGYNSSYNYNYNTNPPGTYYGQNPRVRRQPAAVRFIQREKIHSQLALEEGELAVQRAQNPQLRELGRQIVQQQTRNQQELHYLDQTQNFTQPVPLPGRMRQDLADLQQQTGQSFDQAIARALLASEAHNLRQTQRAMQDNPDPQVRQFARQILQGQQHNLEQAVLAAREVGVSQNAINSYLYGVPQPAGRLGSSQGQFTSNG